MQRGVTDQGGVRRGEEAPVVVAEGLEVTFGRRSAFRRTPPLVAVRGVSFEIRRGETLGLVGESGSGKSTTGRGLLRLVEPSAGRVVLDGTDITHLGRGALRAQRRKMQMVFQDPYSSLDPSAPIGESIAEPLIVHDGLSRGDALTRAGELLERVGLRAAHVRRYPYEFSGGQRQRVAIARAIALTPQLVVCDEAVSALDVSTQNQVINLLEDLQRESGMAYLFIAHDLSVVEHISDRVAVMYLGSLVEAGTAEQIFGDPHHPYTQALLSASPVPDPDVQRSRSRIVLEGDLPDPRNPPPGCAFATRCPHVMDVCRVVDPPPAPLPDGGMVRCHLHPPPGSAVPAGVAVAAPGSGQPG